jgi:sodium/proline symporter
MSGSSALLATLVAYKLVLVAIGLALHRRTQDAADFFLGGRRLGPWVAALSASASSSSAWTLLGVSGAAYAWGLRAVWIFPACVGGFALNWIVLAPRLRRFCVGTDALTVTDVLAGPRGTALAGAIRRCAAAIILASLVVYVASQFQGAGKTFHETFDLPLVESIVLGSVIVVAYTLLGGFWAVSVTDMVQGIVMALASVALPVAAWIEVGGYAGLAEGLASVEAPGFTSLLGDLTGPAAVGLVLGFLGIGLGYPGQPHVVNRFMALRDDASVARGRTIALGWAVVLYAGMIVLGLCARVLFPGLPDGEVAFITATQQLFSPVAAGVLLAAVLSAIMSTADSQLLVAGSAVAHDWAQAGSNHAGETDITRSRGVVLVLGAVAVVAALLAPPAIFSNVLFAWTAMGAAFGPLLIVLVVSGPVAPRARLAAIILGFAAAVATHAIPEARGTAWERVMPFVLSLAVTLWGRTGSSRETPSGV